MLGIFFIMHSTKFIQKSQILKFKNICFFIITRKIKFIWLSLNKLFMIIFRSIICLNILYKKQEEGAPPLPLVIIHPIPTFLIKDKYRKPTFSVPWGISGLNIVGSH